LDIKDITDKDANPLDFTIQTPDADLGSVLLVALHSAINTGDTNIITINYCTNSE